MHFYVVVDAKGSGRLLGVFDSRERAERLTARYPAYYKLHVAQLNRINPEVLDWVDCPEQRRYLERLIRDETEQ